MSRKSPLTKNQPYKRQVSPLSYNYDNTSYNDKYHPQTDYRDKQSTYTKTRNPPNEIGYRMTQKKTQGSMDAEGLFEKNRALSKENAELYVMLKERGKIVTALQEKLEDQIAREVQTLDIIEQEKNKFIKDSQRKFKQYQIKIESLIKENYFLKEDKDQQNMIKAHEIDLIKDTLTKQQLAKMQNMASLQMSAREQSDYQLRKTQHLLKMKNNQLEETRLEHDRTVQKLKNEIIELNNELVHMAHLKKLELSDQKVMFEDLIDKLNRQNDKSKELSMIEYDLLLKKLEKQLTNKQIQNSKLCELNRIQNIEASARQIELAQKRDQLESQIKQLQEFYRQKAHDDVQLLKTLTKEQLKTIATGNEAINNNLKNEIEKLLKINQAKTDELNKLYAEISSQRKQSADSIKDLQNVIEELKLKMRKQENQFGDQLQALKVKWAQLSQADIQALKTFYEREIQALQHQLLQKTKLADSNREKLHQELQDKNQMRKRFDLQTLRLNTRISELQLQVNELTMTKKEQSTALNAVVGMTNLKLLRQTTDKEKGNLTNQEEKKKLQELINAKDRQIQELNEKIKIMRDNYSREIAQKNAQIQIVKKHNEDLELELRKQKCFYDGQVKKKDAALKSEKQFHDEEINTQRNKFKKQYDDTVQDMSSQINKLEVQINRLKAIEKNLRNEIASLKQNQQTMMGDRQEEQKLILTRHNTEKKQIESKLKKYYAEEIRKLEEQLDNLKKQLQYKQQDLREMAQRHHELQQKMQAVIHSQDRLSYIEQMILGLGQDNNLIKNIADLGKGKQ